MDSLKQPSTFHLCLLTVRRGADPDQGDRRGSRPAHRAAKVGSFEILMHLSAFGAKFDVCDIEMKSPIHWATGEGEGEGGGEVGEGEGGGEDEDGRWR